MVKLTKTEAARQLGIASATLYKLIAQGKVSPTPGLLLDSRVVDVSMAYNPIFVTL